MTGRTIFVAIRHRRMLALLVLLSLAAADFAHGRTLAEAPGFAGGSARDTMSMPVTLAAADDESVKSAREALSEGDFPWYDRQADSLGPMDLTADRPQRRNFRWPDLGGALQVLVYLLVGLVLVMLVALLVYFIRNQEPAPKVPRVVSDQVLAPDQVEALQFLAERPRDDLLGQARRHYEAGNYSEAIIYLFSYELLALDKVSFIQLAKGKTNRQYLRELSRDMPLRSPLERTLIAFESVFFGNRPLDRSGFEACWQELPQFEQLRAQT